jgi:hypothetical protein
MQQSRMIVGPMLLCPARSAIGISRNFAKSENWHSYCLALAQSNLTLRVCEVSDVGSGFSAGARFHAGN